MILYRIVIDIFSMENDNKNALIIYEYNNILYDMISKIYGNMIHVIMSPYRWISYMNNKVKKGIKRINDEIDNKLIKINEKKDMFRNPLLSVDIVTHMLIKRLMELNMKANEDKMRSHIEIMIECIDTDNKNNNRKITYDGYDERGTKEIRKLIDETIDETIKQLENIDMKQLYEIYPQIDEEEKLLLEGHSDEEINILN